MTIVTDNTNLVITPTVQRLLRRSLFWIVIVVVVLLLALIGILTVGATADNQPLAGDNAAPGGAKGVVEVLRHEGVDVILTGSLDDTQKAASDPGDTTLLVYDPNLYLTSFQLGQLGLVADQIVLLEPSYDALNTLAPDVAPAGYVGDDELDADCDLSAATQAERIRGEGSGYRVLDDADGVTACFGSGDEIFSVLQSERGGNVVTVVGSSSVVTNGLITESGNAALALNLLGSTETLIWYIPTEADLPPGDPTAAELSPGWVMPVALVTILTGIAAALWRGRRFGPLIVENLPVTVKASETMQGRARLYQQNSARLHTLDSLRIGTIDRLAKLCGLPTLATVDEVIAASSALSRLDLAWVRSVLLDAQPSTDRDLIKLSDDLLTLEQLVAHRLRAE